LASNDLSLATGMLGCSAGQLGLGSRSLCVDTERLCLRERLLGPHRASPGGGVCADPCAASSPGAAHLRLFAERGGECVPAHRDLFARPRYDHFYFGDYYDRAFFRSGIYPVVSFHNSRYGYDPVFARYVATQRMAPAEFTQRLRDDTTTGATIRRPGRLALIRHLRDSRAATISTFV